MTRHRDLFTARQLVALATLSDLVAEARRSVIGDGGSDEYADAVATYLAFAVSRLADYQNSLATWNPTNENLSHLFQRQAIPMAWDFAEANAVGSELSIGVAASWVASGLHFAPTAGEGRAVQLDAAAALPTDHRCLVVTDPPYYDNIGYSDLSDFFYVWLRRSIGSIHTDLFATVLTPKTQELIASPYRFGGNRAAADHHFEQGFRRAFDRLRAVSHPEYPLAIFYAYKQQEERANDASPVSTGWETMLSGLVESGFQITGTWPVRTTKKARAVARDTNALASAVVLTCRPHPEGARLATRRDFVDALREELPEALRNLQHGNVAPVDFAQTAIGPGMAVFSRYVKVIEADGCNMTVRTALGLINRVLDEILAEQEGDFDPDTRFAIAWFEQFGTGEGSFGVAETLSKAKNVGVNGLVEAGILASRGGKVRLLARTELDAAWDPALDRRMTVWEVTQHLVKRLGDEGEGSAAGLLARIGGLGEMARELAYRVYSICERKGWSQEALAYNALVASWPEIARLAAEQRSLTQQTLGV